VIYLNRIKYQEVEKDNVHRWLVSYADYMTLLFALFVVLYAMAMVNEKPFDTISESFTNIFQNDNLPRHKNSTLDSLILAKNENNNQNIAVNLEHNLMPLTETDIDNPRTLSTVVKDKLGRDLSALQKQLMIKLDKLIDTSFVKLQVKGDWLEIELSSGLLFPSGSSSATASAKVILSEIYNVINNIDNFIRIRGYTDNQLINNEVFSSNWELSVFRATAILKELENQGINPARMAIEGYGQYYPISDNLTTKGRAKNRRVVIALSRYGFNKKQVNDKKKVTINKANNLPGDIVNNSQIADHIKVIKLDNGGIRVTTRNEQAMINNPVKPESNQNKNTGSKIKQQ
jgi:chemotaxis protein MotB